MRKKIHKEDIIKTGVDLMFLKGYNATGIKEITESINIPKGSFYNHFSSKEEFGLEVLKYYTKNGVELHRKLLSNTKIDSPIERLKAMYTAIIDNYTTIYNCKLGCLMGNLSAELADINENFRKLLDEEFKEIEAIIFNCLQEAKEKEEISSKLEVRVLSSFILNSWHGSLIRMKSTKNSNPLKNFMEVIFTKLIY